MFAFSPVLKLSLLEKSPAGWFKGVGGGATCASRQESCQNLAREEEYPNAARPCFRGFPAPRNAPPATQPSAMMSSGRGVKIYCLSCRLLFSSLSMAMSNLTVAHPPIVTPKRKLAALHPNTVQIISIAPSRCQSSFARTLSPAQSTSRSSRRNCCRRPCTWARLGRSPDC